MWSAGPRGCILRDNTYSSRFWAGQHCEDYPVVLSRILDSSRLAAIFAGLEPAGLRYEEHSAETVQAMPHSNLATLCPSITAEGAYYSCGIHLQDLTVIPPSPEDLCVKKWFQH
jgi:hypothetical protein